MPSSTTSEQKTIPPHYEDFHWIHGPGRTEKFADFIALTRDISAGINSCMQIIYTRELVNESNLDADPEQERAPSIGAVDSANLFRLSLAAASLLRDVSEQHIARLNQFWDE